MGKNSKSKNQSLFYTSLVCLIISILIICFSPSDKHMVAIRTISIIVSAFSIVSLFILLLVYMFGSLDLNLGIENFFIGDEGTYSLSRLQAVLWAYVIMSLQVGIIIALVISPKSGGFYYYQPSFSESSIWLLGLSMTSYIAVKGITVNNIAKNPKIFKSKSKNQKWGDILIGSNGLDFSKFQMLIWTIIALFAFLSKCYYFINHLTTESNTNIVVMFTHMYDEYNTTTPDKSPSLPFVPYLPWTFVVLMGLSQGAYVGKKLVPTFKITEAEKSIKIEKDNSLKKIDIEIQYKKNILTRISPITQAGQTQALELQNEIIDLETQKEKITNNNTN